MTSAYISSMFLIRRCLPIIVRHISTSKPHHAQFRTSIKEAFGRHLLLTNTFTAGTLMFVGDLIEQEAQYRRKNLPERYDYARLTRMFVTGIILGPIQHHFYHWLANYIQDTTTKAIAKKIILDQVIMSPVSIGVFFTAMCLMELKPFMDCADELSDKFLHVYLVDWCVGPTTQVVNFRYVPVQYQVLYVNLVVMFYNIYLSYVKHT